MKRLLIICPSFPPNPGIGGRRWVKFAKILFQQGYDVWVFSFKLPNRNENSHWTKDVEELQKNNRIIEVDRNYPFILDKYPNTFIEKLKYRFWDKYLKLQYKGNTYDRSLRWGKFLIPELRKKIDTNTVIIATGAPFRYLKDLIVLKNDFKVKIFADFRDPWANNTIAYNKGLSSKRLDQEKQNESVVVKNFDKVFSVYHEHIDHLIREHEIPINRFIHLPNGFESFESKKNLYSKGTNRKIRFVFAGSLYEDAEYAFKLFIDFLNEIKLVSPEVYSKIEFLFFGNILSKYDDYFKDGNEVVINKGSLPLSKMQEEIAKADFSMIFLTDFMNYTLNTKFLEAINQGNKVLVFSSPGFLEGFVEKNRIGYSMTKEKMSNSFNQCIIDYNNDNHKIKDLPKEVAGFELNTLTEKIIKSI